MTSDIELIHQLTTLNEIAETLNRASDVKGALETALAHLVDLMGLETGWIFLRDESALDRWWGKEYVLAAHYNLPPALALENPAAWDGGCECQGFCNKGKLDRAYNEVRCSRLAEAGGDRRGLGVHASTPLHSGDRILGILNVAAADWDAFRPETLALLTNVGSQMGIALERAHLFDLLRERRIQEQAALLAFSNELLGRPDLRDLMAYLVEETRRLLTADACALLLCDEQSDMVFHVATGYQGDPVGECQIVPNDGRSMLSRVLRSGRPALVADIQATDMVNHLPDWFKAEGFRGQAVMPLVTERGVLGVLLVNTRQPRLTDRDDTRFLRLLANQAAIALETARLREEEIQRQRLENDLAVGQQIQLSLLPRSCPEVPGWEFAAVYQAARQVGGDFYDFFELPGEPGRWGMVIADVADKGVPAALFMALCRTMIRTTALSGRDAVSTLRRANDLIINDSWSDLFLSAFYAILDTRTGRLTYANAGHNHPVWWSAADGTIRELKTPGRVLGLFPNLPLAQASLDLAPGDLLIAYTDGVTEAMNAAYAEFTEARLYDTVRANADQTAPEVLTAITEAVHAFTGNTPQSDDLTLFVVRRLPPEM